METFLHCKSNWCMPALTLPQSTTSSPKIHSTDDTPYPVQSGQYTHRVHGIIQLERSQSLWSISTSRRFAFGKSCHKSDPKCACTSQYDLESGTPLLNTGLSICFDFQMFNFESISYRTSFTASKHQPSNLTSTPFSERTSRDSASFFRCSWLNQIVLVIVSQFYKFVCYIACVWFSLMRFFWFTGLCLHSYVCARKWTT